MKAVTTITIIREISDDKLLDIYDFISDKKAFKDAKETIRQTIIETFSTNNFDDEVEVNVQYFRDAKGRLTV